MFGLCCFICPNWTHCSGCLVYHRTSLVATRKKRLSSLKIWCPTGSTLLKLGRLWYGYKVSTRQNRNLFVMTPKTWKTSFKKYRVSVFHISATNNSLFVAVTSVSMLIPWKRSGWNEVESTTLSETYQNHYLNTGRLCVSFSLLFIFDRNPNGEGLAIWPQYDLKDKKYLEWRGPNDFKQNTSIREKYCNFWNEINKNFNEASWNVFMDGVSTEYIKTVRRDMKLAMVIP